MKDELNIYIISLAMANQAQSLKDEVHAVQGDLTKEEDVLRVIKWTRDNLGGVDVLVNNAGIGYRVHLSGQRITENPGLFFYASTKHAVRVLTDIKRLRRELRNLKTQIRVTAKGLKMERWTGRVALVTGAGSGIGEAIACILFENGMKVVAADIELSRVETLAQNLKDSKGKFHPIQCDVTKEEDVVRVVKWTRENIGGADVLVNCAGFCFHVNLTDVATEKIRKMFDVNVVGLSLCTREVIKDMRDRGVDDGHIFHLCSIAGQRIPNWPGTYLYSASKHAVMVLTEGLRRELRDLKTKIKITGISPGFVRTRIQEAAGVPKEQIEQFYNSIGNYLMPRDIAEALLYSLATPPHVQVHEITIIPTAAQGS